MALSRRSFFTRLGKSAGYVALIASLPGMAWAKWNQKAFTATKLDAAINARFGDAVIEESAAVELDAPPIAEDGATVTIKVKTDLPDVKSISLFVKDNPAPLITTLHLGPSSIADIQIRIRMGKSSEVTAIVDAGNKLYKASQQVKVTLGGCGG